MIPLSLAFRHSVQDNTGRSTLQLYGHPRVVHIPSVVSAELLYMMVQSLMKETAHSLLAHTYTILFTDGQVCRLIDQCLDILSD